MVSETIEGGEFINKFMKLEKQVHPISWIKINNFEGKVYDSWDQFDPKERKSCIIPYSQVNFYTVYDHYERNEVKDFVIYPIMKKTFWVVQVG